MRYFQVLEAMLTCLMPRPNSDRVNTVKINDGATMHSCWFHLLGEGGNAVRLRASLGRIDICSQCWSGELGWSRLGTPVDP